MALRFAQLQLQLALASVLLLTAADSTPPGTPRVPCGAKFAKFPAKSPRADLMLSNSSSAFDSYNIMSPFVAQIGTSWHMYYAGGPSTSPQYLRYQLGLATAPTANGPWTKHGQPLLPLGVEDNFHCTPTLLRDEHNAVVREGGQLHMLFAGNRNRESLSNPRWHTTALGLTYGASIACSRSESMYHAVSTDGIKWTMDPKPVYRGYAPSVLRGPDGQLWLYYINTWKPGLWQVELAKGATFEELKFEAVVLTAATQHWETGNLFCEHDCLCEPWLLSRSCGLFD